MRPPEAVSWSWRVVDEIAAPKPERFLFLRVPPEASVARKIARGVGGDDVFNLKFMTALQHAYERLIARYYDDAIILDWEQFGGDHCMDHLLEQVLGVSAV